MLSKIYNWTLNFAGHRNALSILALVSFFESSIFPIPPDILIIPMVLAAPKKAWQIATVCTLASVLGGLAGYGIGYSFYESLGKPLLEFYGYYGKFEDFQMYYFEWGSWIVGGAGLTPFPYKVVTIASGVAQLDLVVFVIASVFSRGLRFFIVAGLLWYFGESIRVFIEKNLGIIAIIFFSILLGGFLFFKLIL